mgnify:CR=1 FL=1
MKNGIAILLNYLTWGFILGFITGINISIFINFLSPPITNSISAFQFIFDHAANWALNGLCIGVFLGVLYLCYQLIKTKNNKQTYQVSLRR